MHQLEYGQITITVLLVLRVNQEEWALMGAQDLKDLWVHRDHQVLQDLVFQEPRVIQDFQVALVSQVYLDRRVNKVRQVRVLVYFDLQMICQRVTV